MSVKVNLNFKLKGEMKNVDKDFEGILDDIVEVFKKRGISVSGNLIRYTLALVKRGRPRRE